MANYPKVETEMSDELTEKRGFYSNCSKRASDNRQKLDDHRFHPNSFHPLIFLT